MNLKEIKNVLYNIPDAELEVMSFNVSDERPDQIVLCAMEGDGISDFVGYPEVFHKYPEVNRIGKLLDNILESQRILDTASLDERELFWEYVIDTGIEEDTIEKWKEYRKGYDDL